MAAPSNLREQIKEIAIRRVGAQYAVSTTFPDWVDYLAKWAFIDRWPESSDTRAIRTAAKMLHGEPGYVDPSVPPIE